VTKQTETKQTNKQILGIHHITAIAGDPQTNLDFYTGVLGLRLVKLTVNGKRQKVFQLDLLQGTRRHPLRNCHGFSGIHRR
jgi:catechol 2,3-dioxygenase-like lactoylglutathione lyase family enzyme